MTTTPQSSSRWAQFKADWRTTYYRGLALYVAVIVTVILIEVSAHGG